MVTTGLTALSGGRTACRRLPSASRASTYGRARSSRSPSGPTTRSTAARIASVSANDTLAGSSRPALDPHLVGAVADGTNGSLLTPPEVLVKCYAEVISTAEPSVALDESDAVTGRNEAAVEHPAIRAPWFASKGMGERRSRR